MDRELDVEEVRFVCGWAQEDGEAKRFPPPPSSPPTLPPSTSQGHPIDFEEAIEDGRQWKSVTWQDVPGWQGGT